MAETSTNKANHAPRPAAVVKEKLGDRWLPELYSTLVKAKRTRAVPLPVPARLNRTDIYHTLLGIELQVGKTRISCPDLATARYLAVFARIGCQAAAVPYDITQVSHLADELESAWQRMLLLAEEAAGPTAAEVSRLQKSLARQIREEIENLGAGPLMPQFNQNTKQRGVPS